MPNSLRGLAAALALIAVSPLPGLAQSQPAVGTTVEPDQPVLVDVSTQQRIRDYVMRQNAPSADIAEVAIGAVLPESVTLYTLPEDALTGVPTVTAYKFAPVGNRIVVVDPAKRTVVQLIDK
jgi:hypothetical protein